MFLSEVFDQLTHGELSQVNIGGSTTTGITEENYPAMVSHVNLGLTNLYKRFLLKEGTVFLERQAGMQTYTLHSNYQVGNRASREAVRYIDASVPAFMDDILKVERVYNELGEEQSLNDEGNSYSIMTPTYNTLVIPAVSEVEGLRIVYRANHPKIVIEDGDLDPTEVSLQLPDSHLEALLLFVASRVLNPVGMSQQFHDGNNYAAKFEQACQYLENQNLRVDKTAVNNRLQRNGWV